MRDPVTVTRSSQMSIIRRNTILKNFVVSVKKLEDCMIFLRRDNISGHCEQKDMVLIYNFVVFGALAQTCILFSSCIF